MSKFFEARERLNGKAPRFVSTEDAEDRHVELASSAFHGINPEESGPDVDPNGEIKHQGEIKAIEEDDRHVFDGTTNQETLVSGTGVSATDSTLNNERTHPAYERILQRLFAFRKSPRQGVILVAGAVPGEGASTIARNTAIALKRGRSEQVVLVDVNLRNPSQHEAFGVELQGGLSDVLQGPTSLTSAVKTDVGEGLSLVTAGCSIDGHSCLLTASALQGVMMALTSFFDWVIVDGPPVTTYAESASVAAASGGAVMVIRAEKTRQEVAQEAKRVLEDSGTEVLGAVLNRRKFHIPGFIYRRL